MEELIDALNNVNEAKIALDRAKAACSRDYYFCHPEQQDFVIAKRNLEQALNNIVDKRIEEREHNKRLLD